MKILSGICIAFCLCIGLSLHAQDETVYLKNPSFEGIPRAGGTTFAGISAAGWIDCGGILFPSESPPDIHPNNIFRVTTPPQDGKTYIGLVARENESWESVSQLLSVPLEEGKCYSMNLFLARSKDYVNRQSTDETDDVKSQGNPLVLRIYGGLRPCEKKQILAESGLVSNTNWENYEFEFEAGANIYYITLEAFYKTPVLLPYNGNLLVDNISPITRIACPDEPALAVEPPATPATPTKPEPKKEVIAQIEPEPEITKPEKPEEIVPKVRTEKTITSELSKQITAGQTIQINNLYFQADKSDINSESFVALDEVYDFLDENPSVRIEIGGHTNDIPKDDYCDKLSADRAKAVAEYISRKGIRASRLEFKGYGKRNPIASNKTKEGRKRNQRVEIKILNVD